VSSISPLIYYIDNKLKEANSTFFLSDKNKKWDYQSDPELMTNDELEKMLDNSESLNQWITLRAYCKKEIIEKCALKILKRNFNCHFLINYFYYSAEENVLRYLHKITVQKHRESDLFVAPLKKMTRFQKVIEKVKEVFNSRIFKIAFIGLICISVPNFSQQYVVKVAPVVKYIGNTYLPIQAIRVLIILKEWTQSLYLIYYFMNYLTLKNSFLNHTFSYVSKVVYPFSMHSSMCVYPDLTNIYYVYVVLTNEFHIYKDRNAECEDLLVNMVMGTLK
jgi:hypothetical protein